MEALLIVPLLGLALYMASTYKENGEKVEGGGEFKVKVPKLNVVNVISAVEAIGVVALLLWVATF